MTTYSVIQKEKEKILEIKGHANYADKGYDIVCAGISTACIFSTNLIEKLNLRLSVLDLICEEGYFRLQVKTDNVVSNNIFITLEETLEDLANQYPKYVKKIK